MGPQDVGNQPKSPCAGGRAVSMILANFLAPADQATAANVSSLTLSSGQVPHGETLALSIVVRLHAIGDGEPVPVA
jgi:hypothetical protein